MATKGWQDRLEQNAMLNSNDFLSKDRLLALRCALALILVIYSEDLRQINSSSRFKIINT